MNRIAKGDKSCISLALVHSKGIPLVSAYLLSIGGISYSVDNWQIWLESAQESGIIKLSIRKEYKNE